MVDKRSTRRPRGPRPQPSATARKQAEPSEVASLLANFLQRDGRTLNSVAQAASVDVGYLWHLQAGTKQRPSRDVLIRRGLALKLEPEEVDDLLVAADHAPITARRL